MTTVTFRNSRVLITGGLGFVGSNLAIRLANEGAQVSIVDNLGSEGGGNRYNIAGLEERLAIRLVDIRDESAMGEVVHGQDYLFNLAGLTGHIGSMEHPLDDLDVNCRGHLVLLEACRQYNADVKIVFAGTRQVYGRPSYLPVDEGHPIRPVDINGIHNLAAEEYHRLYYQVHRLRTCVLRLTNTYGPRMRIKDSQQGFIGLWVRLVLEQKPFEIWGGDQVRDPNYVDDVVEAFLQAAASPLSEGRIYNLGSEQGTSLKELGDQLIEANGGGNYEIRSFPADRQLIDIGDYVADCSRIREEIGWQQKTSFAEGVAQTLAYFRDRLPHYL